MTVPASRTVSRRGLAAVAALAALLLAACGGSAAVGDGAATDGDAGRAVDAADRFPGWRTDFEKATVPLDEIISGGPGKDGIPAIDEPRFVDPVAGDDFLEPDEPVIALEIEGDARAYPLQILVWHEIVNDVVGGEPVLVTFCPLCNTAIVMERTLDGVVYDFGTTGRLRYSDLVMYDRQTESWWQQITGEAIVGELAGRELAFLPSSIVSWREFKANFPAGRVLSRDTGFVRSYGVNPYAGYDSVDSSPFLYSGPDDPRLRPMERVATVSLGGEDVAYPFAVLEAERVVSDSVGGRPVVVFFTPGVASALDAGAVAEGRDVGATGVFVPEVGGRPLTFSAEGDEIVDGETGSRWNVLGRAVAGPLEGAQLEPIVHANHFWFAWAVFKPDTRVYGR